MSKVTIFRTRAQFAAGNNTKGLKIMRQIRARKIGGSAAMRPFIPYVQVGCLMILKGSVHAAISAFLEKSEQ